jgi:hypothetical protein
MASLHFRDRKASIKESQSWEYAAWLRLEMLTFKFQKQAYRITDMSTW